LNVFSGWMGLVLLGYITVGLFYVAAASKKALLIAAQTGGLRAEAGRALAQPIRSRFLWLKNHRSDLPKEAQIIADRAIGVDLSCWFALGAVFVIYGLQFVSF
jgi:hypothetical protein